MMKLADIQLIRRIAERAVKLYVKLDETPPPLMFIVTELTFVHTEIVPLRLADLLEADDGNFAHDIAGIHNNLTIARGRPHLGCFMPRFALHEKEGAR